MSSSSHASCGVAPMDCSTPSTWSDVSYSPSRGGASTPTTGAPPSPQIKVAIAGLDTQEAKARIEQLLSVQDKLNVKIVAVCDPDGQYAKWVRDNLGAEVAFTTSLEDILLHGPPIDAVWVTCDVSDRGMYVIQALRAGKSVVCQPPVCSTAKEWNEIKTRLTAAGKPLLLTPDCGCGMPGPDIQSADVMKYTVYSTTVVFQAQIQQDLLHTFYPMIHYALDMNNGFINGAGRMIPSSISVVHTVGPPVRPHPQSISAPTVSSITAVLQFNSGVTMIMSHILIPKRADGVVMEVYAHQRNGQDRSMVMPSCFLATSPFEHLKQEPRDDQVRFHPLQPWDAAADRITCNVGEHMRNTIGDIRGNLDTSRQQYEQATHIQEMERCFEVVFALRRAHELDRPVSFDNRGKARM